MFVFLSVSVRCLTKGKLKKRKQKKTYFLIQYAFQTKGSSAVDELRKQTGQSWRGREGVLCLYTGRDQFPPPVGLFIFKHKTFYLFPLRFSREI